MDYRFLHHIFGTGLLLALLSTAPANAATYQLAGSELQGASGVIVNGLSYDVIFMDGSCIGLFGGCNDASDFTFHNQADAAAASQALVAQVFDAGDIYDTNPELTRGIESTSSGIIFTPYQISASTVLVGALENRSGALVDTVFCDVVVCSTGSPTDFSIRDNITWAKWSAASVVPVPAAVWLFGTAILGLAASVRRRKLGYRSN